MIDLHSRNLSSGHPSQQGYVLRCRGRRQHSDQLYHKLDQNARHAGASCQSLVITPGGRETRARPSSACGDSHPGRLPRQAAAQRRARRWPPAPPPVPSPGWPPHVADHACKKHRVDDHGVDEGERYRLAGEPALLDVVDQVARHAQPREPGQVVRALLRRVRAQRVGRGVVTEPARTNWPNSPRLSTSNRTTS